MTAITFGRIPDVPICETGTWETSTGQFTFTTDDFAAAVKAIEECPAIRNPAIWLGHTSMTGKPTNGLPAVGWLGGIRATNEGHTLTADYEGMPAWLAETLPTAYPDRSIEGAYGFKCTLGHTHDFVITGIALLGVEEPAVGVLTSLQDIEALFTGEPVAATAATERAFRIRGKEPLMPAPVLATVSADDIRRVFYEDAPWDAWIREIDIDPAQIIVESDDGLVRMPYTISGDDITFGDAVPVVTEYRDKTPSVAAQVAAQAAALGARTVHSVYATREASRPDTPKPPTAPVADPKATAGGTDPKEAAPMADTLLEGLRKQLGLADDADEATILAANAEALAEKADPPAALTPPPGTVLIDTAALEDLKVAAARGDQAFTRQERDDRLNAVDAAVRAGRIPPARREHWLKQLEADPGAATVLAALPTVVPLTEVGAIGGGEDEEGDFLDQYGDVMSPAQRQLLTVKEA